MDISKGFIADPVIAPSGKIYSAKGIVELLKALFPFYVDDGEHSCRGREKGKEVKDGEGTFGNPGGGYGIA